MPPSELGALIRAARKQAGYPTLYAFCKATGISRGHMHGLEAGEHSPSIETLEVIFDAIGWDVIVEFRPRKP